MRLHRLRLSGELCELRDRDLYLSLAESGALLANFGVHLTRGELALLHRRSEGWTAALQMAALTLRTSADPAQVAGALDVRGHAIAEYFISEVIEQQPPEVAAFMLETSVLDELTVEACAAVTGRQDAAALLRGIEVANLFLVALDDDRRSYRYHHLVHQLLRAELHAGRSGTGARAATAGGRVAGVRGRHAGRGALFPGGRASRPGHWRCCTNGW